MNYSIVIVGVLFFIFGFITWLNGSLMPYLKELCDLSDFEALFVTFSFYIAYSIMALPMSYLLDKIGYKRGMSLGLLIMSIGTLLFIPSAFSKEYLLFLFALFILATGLTILQSASNPYIVYLGDIQSAARRISIMGIINKLAGILAPILFTILITIDSNNATVMAKNLMLPYLGISAVLLILIIMVKFLPDIKPPFQEEKTDDSILNYPQVIFGSIALFFYVGIEVIAGDTITLYAQNLLEPNYSIYTSYTMFFMVIGYVLGVLLIPKYILAQKALLYSALLGIFLTLCIVVLPPNAMLVALLGLSNAIVWPAIWQLSLDGVGKMAQRASALLIIAIAGGALLPLLFGKLSQTISMQHSYSIAFVCYGVIFLYALKRSKV